MLRNDDGLFGKSVNFDKVIIYQGETAQVTPLVLAGTSITRPTVSRWRRTKAFVRRRHPRRARARLHRPGALLPLGEGRAFQDKRLRQAVAIGDQQGRERKRSRNGDSAKPQKYMAGFSDNLVPQWLSRRTWPS